jgi:hypothetical protein
VNVIARMLDGKIFANATPTALVLDSGRQNVRRFTLGHSGAIEVQHIEGRIPPYVTPLVGV